MHNDWALLARAPENHPSCFTTNFDSYFKLLDVNTMREAFLVDGVPLVKNKITYSKVRRPICLTEKNRFVLAEIIDLYSPFGVLDPYSGSMATALGCVLTSRKCISLESDAVCFMEASQRLYNFLQADRLNNQMSFRNEDVPDIVGCARNEVKNSDAFCDKYHEEVFDDQHHVDCNIHDVEHILESIPHHSTVRERDTQDVEAHHQYSNIINSDDLPVNTGITKADDDLDELRKDTAALKQYKATYASGDSTTAFDSPCSGQMRDGMSI